MNKTIIININGTVFHIEEDAYELLKGYMTDVKRHFMNSADSLEITTDIENRIAEMFTEILLRENKQVIIEQDVNFVTEQMGSVADFETADSGNEPSGSFYTHTDRRRLFRDPDDYLVAGVCAGIANYFEMNPAWVRLAFAFAIAFAGTGLILYTVLWIVVPKAITRADRMAMKGEKQNLQGFKKNFEEELTMVRRNLSNFGNEARPFVYRARDFASDLFHHLGNFLNGAGKILVKLLGIFILLCCFSLIIFTVVAFVALMGFGEFTPFNIPYSILRHSHADYIYLTAFLIAFIPLLGIILLTLKGFFNVGSINRATGSSALIIWLCALGVFVFYVVQIVANFKSSASFTETVSLKPTKGNIYYLKLNDEMYLTADDSLRLNIKGLSPNIKITENTYEYNDFEHFENRNVHIHFEKSDVNQLVMIESFQAMGRNYDQALINARNTRYKFSQQDTVLKFDYRLHGYHADLWHNEELYITIKIPLNAQLNIDEKLNNMLEDNINMYDCKNINHQEHATAATFIMTDNGLQCKADTLTSLKKDSLKKDSIIKK